MLPDFKQLLFSALRFRHLHLLTLQFTFPTGTSIALDSANSSPGIVSLGTGAGGLGISRNSAGNYTLNIPKGLYLHYVGGEFAVGASGSAILTPVIKTTNTAAGIVDPAAGTVTLLTLTSAGAETDPAANGRLYLTFALGKA